MCVLLKRHAVRQIEPYRLNWLFSCREYIDKKAV